MTEKSYAKLDIAAHWGRLNESVIALIDVIPDDKIDWSPREALWNFRGILIHIAGTRDYWMGSIVKDGDPAKSAYETARSRDEIKLELERTWDRVRRFLVDPAKLAAKYQEDAEVNGHWIAFHLLEHDIHHRADIFHYLALLEIEHPEVGTP
ncbi:MAG: DinB family protein [Chloroflexi bacterium]|nr:DinB family protein [Chloroflexota bacterium]